MKKNIPAGGPQKKEEEHKQGRFLLNYVLQNFYEIKNPLIEIKNKKPVLKEGKIHFSLSHSNGLFVAGFDIEPVGVDVEFIRKVDIQKLSKRYKKNFSTEKEFFEFWTNYEAEIKLQVPPKGRLTFEFLDDYIVSIASAEKTAPIKIYEIGENLCLKKSEF